MPVFSHNGTNLTETLYICPRFIAKTETMLLTTLLLFGLGNTELILIALVVLLLFGGKKIPELMRGLGKGMKSFKEGMQGMDEEMNKPKQDPTKEKESDKSGQS